MMKEKLRSLFFKIWYWYISTIDKNADVIFMNYGYSCINQKLILEPDDEKNRYSVQLYHHTATSTDIIEKDLLEVGCGRGGGLSYINRNLFPKSVIGVDLNKKAVQFCNTYYKETNNAFFQANAQKLPFEDNSFDVVLNIESSHRYPEPDLFFKEVHRVLKPGGTFLFADFRFDFEIDELNKQLNNTKMQIEQKQDITSNVVEALKLASPEREKIVKKLAPRFLHNLGRNFAATIGSPTYNKFFNRKYLYVFYTIKKNN